MATPPFASRTAAKTSQPGSSISYPSSATTFITGLRGSFSLKSVLPALVPELSYDGLAIAEGEQQALSWSD